MSYLDEKISDLDQDLEGALWQVALNTAVKSKLSELFPIHPEISTTNAQKVQGSLCRVEVENGRETGLGTGTFVSPNIVLTAAHVISGEKSSSTVTVINAEGRRSKMQRKKSGGRNYADIALIELEDHIGPFQSIDVATSESSDVVVEGYLVTNFTNKFNNQAGVYEFNLYLADEILRNLYLNCNKQDGVSPKTSLFHSFFQAGHGHSGSPVVDCNGKIITVLSAAYGEDSARIEEQQGCILQERASFQCPSQSTFADFMDWARPR